ncbi:uncharacterized protein [Centruroides vittatus]|uniref:uncharacterized protein n=1 Tax=Centruroides vittatus TaxID=120091 RepID=UPI00350FE21B
MCDFNKNSIMVQFVCACLNIRIHAKGNDISAINTSDLHLSTTEGDDKFFKNSITKVSLDLGGITKSQNNFVHSRTVGKWEIISCLSCGMDSYANHNDDSDSNVFVNLQLESDKERIAAIMEKPNYSPLFKMLLPITNRSGNENACGFECAIQNKHLEAAVMAVHQQVTSYLHHEQQSMEERIRSYISQQQAEFTVLQNKVHQDKQAILSLLLKLEEQVDNKREVDSNNASNLFLPATSLISEMGPLGESSSSSESNSAKGEQADEVPRTVIHVAKHNSQLYSRTLAFSKSASRRRYIRRSMSQQQRMAQSIDALGGVFNMEGIDSGDESIPFCISDDGSTDESSAAEDSVVHYRRISRRYATSLPINVPSWAAVNHSSGSDEEEEAPPLDDPEQVAASIKALSLSVKDDGTKMFGDLPPSQLTTADLLNSHPLLTGQE